MITRRKLPLDEVSYTLHGCARFRLQHHRPRLLSRKWMRLSLAQCKTPFWYDASPAYATCKCIVDEPLSTQPAGTQLWPCISCIRAHLLQNLVLGLESWRREVCFPYLANCLFDNLVKGKSRSALCGKMRQRSVHWRRRRIASPIWITLAGRPPERLLAVTPSAA